ncbi:hypothetical protein AeNC1_003652 [Aphanomyces euteiches]|nr:hypothetical protein AeNC1_003652 [Aphanomyces euteiches]
MKTSLLFLSTLSASALARVAYSSLSTDEQADVKQQLSNWKTLYAPLASKHGYVPESAIESVNVVDSHTDEELARFHNTLQDVAKAQENNPHAVFSPFNVFALLTQAEFDSKFKNTHYCCCSFHRLVDVQVQLPVKNQGDCGDCWAFSAVGTSEFAHCIATGEKLDLSEQQVTNCDKASNGCNGGIAPYGIDYVHNTGVCLESAYPYVSGTTGKTGSCQSSCAKKMLSIGKTVQTEGEAALVAALNKQPVSVLVEAGNEVWRNYKSGVITQCPGAQVDHAVIAWGENGYIYLQRGVGGNGMCNVVEYISYPTLTGTSVNAPSTSQPTVPPTTSAPTVKPTTAPTFSPTTKPSTTGTSQTTTAPTAKPTSNPSPGGAAAYAQCGGNNFSGPTSCAQASPFVPVSPSKATLHKLSLVLSLVFGVNLSLLFLSLPIPSLHHVDALKLGGSIHRLIHQNPSYSKTPLPSCRAADCIVMCYKDNMTMVKVLRLVLMDEFDLQKSHRATASVV